MKTSIRALTATVVAATALVAGSGGVSAAGAAGGVHADGVIVELGPAPATDTEFADCHGVVVVGQDQSLGSLYVRGSFFLPTSTRGLPCKGWLERSVNNGPWTRIGDVHTNPSNSTGWYYNGDGYRGRVCVGDLLYSNSYSCVGTYPAS
ncbi:hypothetical protein [Embleya sp. NPDC020886]|uniref:hypothetical protein n=1 Tax=Embleya sp. NPDC020886 TaxID=3363980 RepID=UPI0037B8A474